MSKIILINGVDTKRSTSFYKTNFRKLLFKKSKEKNCIFLDFFHTFKKELKTIISN